MDVVSVMGGRLEMDLLKGKEVVQDERKYLEEGNYQSILPF